MCVTVIWDILCAVVPAGPNNIASVSEPPDVHAAVCPSKHAMAMHPIVNLGQTLNNMKHRASTCKHMVIPHNVQGRSGLAEKWKKHAVRRGAFSRSSHFGLKRKLQSFATPHLVPQTHWPWYLRPSPCQKMSENGGIWSPNCGHLIGTMMNESLDLGSIPGYPVFETQMDHNDG